MMYYILGACLLGNGIGKLPTPPHILLPSSPQIDLKLLPPTCLPDPLGSGRKEGGNDSCFFSRSHRSISSPPFVCGGHFLLAVVLSGLGRGAVASFSRKMSKFSVDLNLIFLQETMITLILAQDLPQSADAQVILVEVLFFLFAD